MHSEGQRWEGVCILVGLKEEQCGQSMRTRRLEWMRPERQPRAQSHRALRNWVYFAGAGSSHKALSRGMIRSGPGPLLEAQIRPLAPSAPHRRSEYVTHATGGRGPLSCCPASFCVLVLKLLPWLLALQRIFSETRDHCTLIVCPMQFLQVLSL